MGLAKVPTGALLASGVPRWKVNALVAEIQKMRLGTRGALAPTLGAARALGARLRSCGLCLRGRVLSTAEGHRVMYDREVPFEIRNQTDPHDSAQEVFPASARPAPSAVLS